MAGPSSSRLDAVAPGQAVVVDHIEGAVDGTVLRLMELGLVPGASVTVTRRAPLGDPLELAVLGTRVCLRRHEARAFVVSPAPAVTP
jgi:Fe2+ transport system protein FeoA